MSPAETVGWDDDSDDEQPLTPQQPGSATPSAKAPPTTTDSPASSTTIHKPDEAPSESSLKPVESRRSEDMHSQPGSDASYDVVSGATSRAPGSPKEARVGEKKDDDDDEDWE